MIRENVSAEKNENADTRARLVSARKKGSGMKWKNWTLYLLILPTSVYVLIFHYLPILGTIIGFKDYTSYQGIFGSPWTGNFGFKHFINFVKLPNFWTIVGNTLELSVYSIVLNTVLPVILALFINEIRWNWAKKSVQIISYAPYFISTVVLVGMLFSFSDLESGVFNKIITAFGGTPSNIMESDAWFSTIYVFSGLWQGLGWWSIVYFGALGRSGKDTAYSAYQCAHHSSDDDHHADHEHREYAQRRLRKSIFDADERKFKQKRDHFHLRI